MANNLIQSPIPASSHTAPQLSKIKQSITSISVPISKPNYSRYNNPYPNPNPNPYPYPYLYPYPSSGFTLRICCTTEEHNSGLLTDDAETISLTKASIYQSLEGINRGVFGVTSSKKREIEDLVMKLEANNPTPNPTQCLDKVSGCWKLIYSTITILGSKRTKLGLRDFINLGDFLQIIDIDEGKAVNLIKFNASGLSLLNGQLTIQASFSIASPSRVNIKYDSSQIIPEQLMNLFKKNYELLLGIFNPEGWLEITYVDDTMRIGRDDKGNIFILERGTENDS